MPARLYWFELSHPSQAARLAMELKGFPYEVRILPAGLHPALLRLSGFPRGVGPAARPARVGQPTAPDPGAADERVDELLQAGVIGGEQLNAADLQVGCSVRVLLTFPQLVPYLAGRPCEAHARRVLPEAPEPVPLRLPEAWLPA